jgi:predicted component of type VI protein secretion system
MVPRHNDRETPVSVQTEVPLSIHWEEGQLLQPHQFQQLQRSADAVAAFERSAGAAYPYGLLS